MTYVFVAEHSYNALYCYCISICMLVYYLYVNSLFYRSCTFVREYYFGLQIDI